MKEQVLEREKKYQKTKDVVRVDVRNRMTDKSKDPTTTQEISETSDSSSSSDFSDMEDVETLKSDNVNCGYCNYYRLPTLPTLLR